MGMRELNSLIRLGADINKKNRDGDTPLHLVLSAFNETRGREYYALAKVLASKELDLNIQNNEGMTVLHLACDLGLEEIADALAEKRHWVDLKDKKGETVLDKALNKGFKNVARKELELGASKEIYTSENVALWFEAAHER